MELSSTTTELAPEMVALAERFFGAITAGNIDVVRSCYDPEVVIWHNFDGIEQDLETNLQSLSFVVSHWTNFRYEQVRRRSLAGGFIQQHTIRGEGTDGIPFVAPATVIVTVTDGGKISRIEEYLDSGQLPALA